MKVNCVAICLSGKFFRWGREAFKKPNGFGSFVDAQILFRIFFFFLHKLFLGGLPFFVFILPAIPVNIASNAVAWWFWDFLPIRLLLLIWRKSLKRIYCLSYIELCANNVSLLFQ